MVSWGDFNENLFVHEKQGGLLREEARMKDFCSTLDDCLLVDIGFFGTWFAWERGRIMEHNIRERLDQRVAIDSWLQLFPTYSLKHLPHSFSDHSLLLIETKTNVVGRRMRRFYFESWWTLVDSCEEVIRKLWEDSSGSFLICMDYLADGLKGWAKKDQA
ncbi:uncharacterized protein LOC108474680 [Gossypium arboreum]|uniref:uncharacterized protein LOC108474680 n=1 Tax=Gossypium arboreum TaxID=29729 RepID=UPI0008190404|nr:uncharacterized protein LOC108474680 [Gossypium arboreum]